LLFKGLNFNSHPHAGVKIQPTFRNFRKNSNYCL